MVGPFDPGDDRDPQLISGAPTAAIEHVLLKQSEEALHGRVVAGRTVAAHRSDHVVATQGVNELAASKLTAAVAVQNATGHVAAACHRTTERGRGQPGFIRESIEYPTMRLENTSLIAHM